MKYYHNLKEIYPELDQFYHTVKPTQIPCPTLCSLKIWSVQDEALGFGVKAGLSPHASGIGTMSYFC